MTRENEQEPLEDIVFLDSTVWASGSYPELPSGNKRLQAQGRMSYRDFSVVLVKLGELALNGITITRNEPAKDTETPVVSFGVVHKTPVPYEVKPRWRHVFPGVVCKWENKSKSECTRPECPNFPFYDKTCGAGVYPDYYGTDFVPEGKSVVVWGRRFRYTVQFNCFGKTSTEADDAADAFEEFMFAFTGVLKYKGACEILYNERLIDESVKKWREDIYARSIRYIITLEDLYTREFPIMKHFDVVLSEAMRQDPSPVALFNAVITIT